VTRALAALAFVVDAVADRIPQGVLAAHLIESVQTWMFTTTVGRQMVMVGCSVMLPRALTADEKQERIQQAAGEFGEMIRRISIRPVP
jgi:predicted anti-sigma-YlaC factor YlaD